MREIEKFWFPVYSDQGTDPVGYLDIVDGEDGEPEYSFEFHLITDRQFEEVGVSRYFLRKVYDTLDFEDAEQLKNLERVVPLD